MKTRSIIEAVQGYIIMREALCSTPHYADPTITIKDGIVGCLKQIIYREKWQRNWRFKIVLLALRLI